MKKIITLAVVAALMLCGCQSREQPKEGSPLKSEVSSPDTAIGSGSKAESTAVKADSDSDKSASKASSSSTASSKNTSSKSTSSKSTSSKSTSSKSTSSKSTSSKNTSAKSTSSVGITIQGGTITNDEIINIKPENIQQFIIEQPPITTEPEPESTFDNKYEDIPVEIKVDDSWFDDCVFIGDSLTVGLGMYNDANAVFGDAKFVCASSLSYWNSQWDLYAPNNVHPYYQNKKLLAEDAPVVTGAGKAVISLGMNDIGIWGADGAMDYTRSLIDKIRAKSPNLKIYIQTVSPMIYNAQKANFNNDIVRHFNENLRKYTEEEGLGFLNSYDAFANSNGNLPYELCSDPGGLGIHLNFNGCKIWAEFIKANIGTAYPGDEVISSDSDIDTTADTDSADSDVSLDTDTAVETIDTDVSDSSAEITESE